MAGQPRFLNGVFLALFTLALTISHGQTLAAETLTAIAGDRMVSLLWGQAADRDDGSFSVERALQQTGPYQSIQQIKGFKRYVDFTVTNGQTYFYRVVSLSKSGKETEISEPAPARPMAWADDDLFLDFVQRTAFEYFWREANPDNGLIRDRSRPASPCSIAAVGFGLTGVTIAVERGWITRDQGRERTLKTLRTFRNQSQGINEGGDIGYKGWFYHFLNLDSADRAWQCELSSIDTALFLAGALSAREFFSGQTENETEIHRLVNEIMERIDWRWMTNGADSLTMGWKPAEGFHRMRWIGYNEAMILYILALGAEKNPLPPEAWKRWVSGYEWETHYGQSYIHFEPLFGHQYSACWIDFRDIADDYTRAKKITYFENSRRATLAQREYAIANPKKFPGYGANIWGITACDGPGGQGYHGYAGRGAPPPLFDDGTIAPTAAGGSIVFTPKESVDALRQFHTRFRTQIWTAYGFRDAFNLKANWWGDDVLGIDQGPILLMIENYRTGAVWKRFMKCPEIQRGLARAGFKPITPDQTAPPAGR